MSRHIISILIALFSCTSLFSQFIDVASNQNVAVSFGTENFGGGLSFSDFNNDGWDDLTVATESGEEIKFFQNNFGAFQLVQPFVSNTDFVKSVLWVDLDNDGDKDFVITCNGAQNRIYKNTGSMQLQDVTSTSGIAMINDPSYGASFGDVNQDGLLDLYISNYSYSSDGVDRLYLNLGNFQFQDISSSSGVLQPANTSFQAHFLDYNNDCLTDIYVAIDKDFDNLLFKNITNTQFQEVGTSSGSGIRIEAMNSSSGDIDNDGDLDLYVTNTPSGNVLLRNNGNNTFTDITSAAGVGFFRIGWGTSFIDVENDGDLDMYVSAMSMNTNDPNALYINNGSSVFSEPLGLTGGLGGNDLHQSFCNISGDFNNDGKQDLAVSNEVDVPIQLWENTSTTGNWIKIALRGQTSNRQGIGAWLSVYRGLDSLFRYSYCGEGYLGQNSDYVHFGLDTIGLIDSLIVKWPSGIIDKYYDIDVNQFIPIVENTSANNTTPCAIIRDVNLLPGGLTDTFNAEQLIRLSGIAGNNPIFINTEKVDVLSTLEIPTTTQVIISNNPCSSN